MSRYFTATSSSVQSTSTYTMANGQIAVGEESNGGHCASPYLKRNRIPKLNTYRHHLEEEEDDDEWLEVQLAKHDLIKLRMAELKNKTHHHRLKICTNNNNNGSSKGLQKLQDRSLNFANNVASSRFDNGNMLSSAAEEDRARRAEAQTVLARCLWFHPSQLFENIPNNSIGSSSSRKLVKATHKS